MAREQNLLCFVHIERAGGTTLHYVLRNNFPTFLTMTPAEHTNSPEGIVHAATLRLIFKMLPWTPGVGGHGVRSGMGYDRAVRRRFSYFTFLRHPVDRYVSHIRYQIEQKGSNLTPEEFLERPYFANFITKRIAGSDDSQRAIERLESDFTFVGLQEKFDDSLLLMRHHLGLGSLDLRYETQNAARRDLSFEMLDLIRSEDFRAKVAAQNRADLRLYSHVERELWPRWLEQIDDLPAQRLALSTSCADFRFSRRRKFAWRVYRAIVGRPVELAAEFASRHFE